MRLGVVSMLRNEADIAPLFLRHLAALFDRAVLVDHRSLDGTGAMLAAACAARPGWALWRAETAAMAQPEVCALALRHLMEETDADAVFLLDADEFLDLPDGAALGRALAGLDAGLLAGRLAWRACVPDRLGEGEGAALLASGDLVWAAPRPSSYAKLVVTRALWRHLGGAVRPCLGNHAISPVPGRDVRYHTIGELLHLPVRSAAQLGRKVVVGRLAMLARTRRHRAQGYHWAEAVARLAAGGLDAPALIGMAAQYGEPGAAARPMSRAGLARAGFSRRFLDVAASPDLDLPPPAPVDALRLVADAVLGWEEGEPGASGEPVLEGGTLRLRRAREIPAGPRPDVDAAAPEDGAKAADLAAMLGLPG